MQKKLKFRILSALLLIISLIFILNNISLAAMTDALNPSDTAVTGSFKTTLNIIIGIFQVVAIGIGAIMIIVLGIKYMSAAPNDKAEIKQHAVIYIVGACLAFASSGIISIFKKLVTESLE